MSEREQIIVFVCSMTQLLREEVTMRTTQTMVRGAMSAGAFLIMVASSDSMAQPYSATLAVQSITSSNATLNGMVTPRGVSTVAWFEWGQGEVYDQTTAPSSAGSSSNVVFISSPIDGLLPNTEYICRVVASNSTGITKGWQSRFTTGRRVASWGRSSLFSAIPPAGLGNVVKLTAGDYHGLALGASGDLVAWGGFLPASPIAPPPGLSNVIEIAGGKGHSVTIKADRTVIAWGNNGSGQTNVPSSLSNVVAVSAGDAHCLALKSDGTVAGWGDLIPSSRFTNIVAIASGDTSFLALRNNGTVIGVPNDPPLFPALNGVVAIAAGYTHALALKTNGTVVAWGSGAGASVPAGLSNVIAIAAGDYHSHAVQSNGTVVTWGNSITGPITAPPGLGFPIGVVCGDEYSMALVASNTPPIPFNRSFVCPMNRDSILILSNSVTDPNGDPLFNYRIVSPPSRGALYQFNSGGRGAQFTSPNTSVTDSLNRVLFVPAADESGAPYTSIGVIASDGQFDSSSNSGSIIILPPPGLSINATTVGSNLLITLNISGFTNRQQIIQYSTNLIDWSIRGSATQTSPGQYSFTDTSVTNQPLRFFRVWAQ